MFYRDSLKHENPRENLLFGVWLDYPSVHISWDTSEKKFVKIFQSHDVERIAKKAYYLKNTTFLGEMNCDFGVYFKRTLYKVALSRNNYQGYEDLIISFRSFQNALTGTFGSPTKRKTVLEDFESCEWDIENKVKIYHYVMDRYGLAEYLYIEKQ